jgi:hypothetical protein
VLPIFIAVCATWVAAGCGGAGSTHMASVTLLPCQLSRFVVTLGPYVSEATGQHTLALRLVNRGSVTCVLDGYPRVALYDADGVIPFVVRHGGDQMISSDAPKAIKIPAGGHAFVVMNKYRCDRGAAPGSRGTRRIRIGSGQARSASASIVFGGRQAIPMPYRIPDYCGSGDPGSTLTVSPFVGTLRAALGG